jgi:tagaturonate reductase
VDGAAEFADAVLDRFRNPFIRHALVDITLQATMKMRYRIVPSIQRYVTQRGDVPQALAFGFAAFVHFKLTNEQQRPDSQAAPIYAAADRQGSDLRAFVEDLCGDESLWGANLTQLPGFTDAVAGYLNAIRTQGVKAAIPTTTIHAS